MAYLSNYINSSSNPTSTKSSRAEIEFLFHKILSPIRKSADPNLVSQLCHKINDIEDTQHIADLIVTKLLSTQEWEVLISLYILEACVKNCGEPMHEIIGRFRFLNELIKLISPKYYGSRTSEATKKKCIELLYSWSRDLPGKPKIKEAYEMIKKQGIVMTDPVDVEELKVNVAPREKNPIFEDDEKSKQLARLLKSRNPADLEMANKIIKNMVKQDEIKTEKISERINELEKMNNNIKLLSDMLFEYNPKTTKSSEKETIKYLYEELEKLQPNLIKLATETDENDDSIGDILKTNDSCEAIIKKYHAVFDSKFYPDDALVNLNSLVDEAPVNDQTKTDSSKDLEDLFSTNNLEFMNSQPIPATTPTTTTSSSSNNIFDDLISVDTDFIDTKNLNNGSQFMMSNSNSLNSIDQMMPLQPISSKADSSLKNKTNIIPSRQTKPLVESKPFDDLNELSNALMGESLSFKSTFEINQIKSQKINDIIKSSNNLNKPSNENNDKNTGDVNECFETLNKTSITLESIKPAISVAPLNLYDKNGVKVVLHFTRDSPAKNIHVLVISSTNMNMQSELKNFLFQAAISKNMRVKLQPASKCELPAYNPILPVTAITQIMLIANPNQEPVRLKFKISYTYEGVDYMDNDEVINFPKLI